MKLTLKEFEKVIKYKSKEEFLIDINATLFVNLNQHDQRYRLCGTRPYVVTPDNTADIIGKFFEGIPVFILQEKSELILSMLKGLFTNYDPQIGIKSLDSIDIDPLKRPQ